jgi:hypothetical protein
MGNGMFAELSQTGENIRRNLVAPLETRIKVDQLNETKAARVKASALADEKKTHHDKAAEELGAMFPGAKGRFAREAYLGGEPGQSIRSLVVDKTKPGKPRKLGEDELLGLFEPGATKLQEMMAQASSEWADADEAGDEAGKAAAMDKYNQLSSAADGWKNKAALMKSDFGKSKAEQIVKDLSEATSRLSPENTAAARKLAGTVLKEHYGLGDDAISGLKELETTLGLKVGEGGFYSQKDLGKLYLNATGSMKRDEALAILQTEDPDELQKIVQNPKTPKSGRDLATALLHNRTMYDQFQKDSLESINENKSVKELSEISGKEYKTKSGKERKKKAEELLESTGNSKKAKGTKPAGMTQGLYERRQKDAARKKKVQKFLGGLFKPKGTKVASGERKVSERGPF